MEKKEWEGDFDPLADPDEKRHLLSVLDSFRSVNLDATPLSITNIQ